MTHESVSGAGLRQSHFGSGYDAGKARLQTEVEQLRGRVVMLLRCHYEEHKHIGSPTCFDVQAPSDEWETDALKARLDAADVPAAVADERKVPVVIDAKLVGWLPVVPAASTTRGETGK